MEEKAIQVREEYTLEVEYLQQLLDRLLNRGYLVVGPTVRDGAIVYEELTSTANLPIGWADDQDAGEYRLKKRGDEATFGYVVGQQSWKKYLHPTLVNLWEAKRKGTGFQVTSGNGEFPKYAFFGVRPCEIQAIAIYDKIFTGGDYVDNTYQSIRKDAFILAVNCGEPGGTCFCASMDSGPKATSGFDLALTEIIEPEHHYFLVEVGTELGGEVISEVPTNTANEEEIQVAEDLLAKAAGEMGREVETIGLRDWLLDNYEHPRWADIADRCLSCGNCTMVCPTCFCNTIEDVTDLNGHVALRRRRWDSCFTVDFAYIHGGSIRPSPMSRYRQWLTHKMATWQDQFGMIGCVGCGRCITWCPVGIDITEEVRAIQGIDAISETCVDSKDKSLETMKRMLAEHPFIREMGEENLEFITECASVVRFNPGEFIFRTGEDAERFYVIRNGKVALETFSPERGSIVVQTIGEGDILGWSWMVEPYKWLFDAKAIEVTRAIAIDGLCIKERCERDPHFGYLVDKYFAQIIGQRIEATRMQFMDVFEE